MTWTPIEADTTDVFLDCVLFERDDVSVFVLVVSAKRLLRLHFEAPIGFREVNETYRSTTETRCRGLWTVEDSEFLAWLRHESGGILADRALTHYEIVTEDHIIDVATEHPPIVRWAAEGERPPWPFSI